MSNEFGICHICGRNAKLTYEHVPPESAFNNCPVKVYKPLSNLPKRYMLNQRGQGGYTLCESCNNRTGSWYAKDYVNFVGGIHTILSGDEDYMKGVSKGSPYSIHDLTPDEPLNVLAIFKQIISMFCSTSKAGTFGYEFRGFLLDKYSTDFDWEHWMVCIYINDSMRLGSSGLVSCLFNDFSMIRYSEILTPHLGMILYDRTSNLSVMKPYGCDISSFSEIQYAKLATPILCIPFMSKGVHFQMIDMKDFGFIQGSENT